MTLPEFDAFSDALTVLGETFDTKLSARRRMAYFEALGDLSWDIVAQGMKDAMRQCKFFPKPAEIREFITGPTSDAAEEAWLLLNEAWREHGRRYSLRCEDPCIVEAVLIAWKNWRDGATALQTAGEKGGAEAHGIHQTFIHAYRLARKREPTNQYLVGVNEYLGEGWRGPVVVSRAEPPMLTPIPERPALSSEELREQEELDKKNAEAMERSKTSEKGIQYEKDRLAYIERERRRERGEICP